MKEYKTIKDVAGPLVFVEKTHPVGYGELVSIRLSNGQLKNGQVLHLTLNEENINQLLGSEDLARKVVVEQPSLWTQNLETLQNNWQNITELHPARSSEKPCDRQTRLSNGRAIAQASHDGLLGCEQ